MSTYSTTSDTSAQDRPHDEPPWSPSLIEELSEHDAWYCCERVVDAELLCNIDLPAIDLPLHKLPGLSLPLLWPVQRLIAFQGPSDPPTYGDMLRQRLEALGWRRRFSLITLPAEFPTLETIWRITGQNRDLFVKDVEGLFTKKEDVRLRPRRPSKNGGPPLPQITSVTGTALLAMTFPTPTQAIPGLVVEGITLFAGRPKEGKSFMALDWCFAVAAAGYALGTIKVDQGDALYVGLEDSYRRLQARLQARLRDAQATDPMILERLHLLTEFPALDAGGVPALAAWLDAHPTCRLVVFDVLQAIAPKHGHAGSAYAADYDMLKDLHTLTLERRLPVVLVTHTTKARYDNIVDEVNATTGLAGKADSIIVLVQTAPGQWSLKSKGRDIEPQDLAVRFDPAIGGWTLLGDATLHNLSAEQQDVVNALRQSGRPMSPSDVAELIGKSLKAVRVLMWRMAQARILSLAQWGQYTLPTPPPPREREGV